MKTKALLFSSLLICGVFGTQAFKEANKDDLNNLAKDVAKTKIHQIEAMEELLNADYSEEKERAQRISKKEIL